jgi:hypothetical protein
MEWKYHQSGKGLVGDTTEASARNPLPPIRAFTALLYDRDKRQFFKAEIKFRLES